MPTQFYGDSKEDEREITGVVTLSDNETSQRLKLSREYQLVRKIGEGGMGQVHLAKTTMVGETQLVAIKMLDKHNMPSIDTLDRFHREAKLLQKVKHNHIVGFGEYFENERYAYLVMEFIDGVDLKSHIEKHGKMPVYQIIEIFVQILKALEYMYSEFKMFHRDLKPENIQVLPSLKTKAMLIDFGNAKENLEDTGHKSLTMISGQMAGTPGYIAPEVDFDDYKQEDDVFAVAVSMLFCLFAHNPFDVESNNVIASWKKMNNRDYDLGDLKETMFGHWLDINLSPKRAERMTLQQAVQSLSMMLDEEPRRFVSEHFVRSMASNHQVLEMMSKLETQLEIDNVIENSLKEIDKIDEPDDIEEAEKETEVKSVKADKKTDESLSALDKALSKKGKADNSFSYQRFAAFALISMFIMLILYYFLILA